MKQNVIIGLALVAVLFTGFAILSHRDSQKDAPKPASELKDIYNQWKLEHSINVGSAEEEMRFKVFCDNYEFIQKHNADPKSTSKLGLNKFAHLTSGEFSALRFGLLNTVKSLSSTSTPSAGTEAATAHIPHSWDWEKLGKVSKVMDQGQCGSSPIIPAVQASESLIAINRGELKELSVQQVIDCASSDEIAGCEGSFPYAVFQYIHDEGLVSAAEYPYTAVDGQCHIPANATRTKIGGYVNVTKYTTEAIKAAVHKNPVASIIDGNAHEIQFYESGIISAHECDISNSHGVLIVGYGTENGTDFWRVKNSWGADWGEKGYFRLQRFEGKEGPLCINMMNNYPTI